MKWDINHNQRRFWNDYVVLSLVCIHMLWVALIWIVRAGCRLNLKDISLAFIAKNCPIRYSDIISRCRKYILIVGFNDEASGRDIVTESRFGNICDLRREQDFSQSVSSEGICWNRCQSLIVAFHPSRDLKLRNQVVLKGGNSDFLLTGRGFKLFDKVILEGPVADVGSIGSELKVLYGILS